METVQRTFLESQFFLIISLKVSVECLMLPTDLKKTLLFFWGGGHVLDFFATGIDTIKSQGKV
jgi:hypothetical protein